MIKYKYYYIMLINIIQHYNILYYEYFGIFLQQNNKSWIKISHKITVQEPF